MAWLGTFAFKKKYQQLCNNIHWPTFIFKDGPMYLNSNLCLRLGARIDKNSSKKLIDHR